MPLDHFLKAMKINLHLILNHNFIFAALLLAIALFCSPCCCESNGDSDTYTTSPSTMENLEAHEWIYFQFHSLNEGDDAADCTTLIDYVHGIRLNECQDDLEFLAMWNSSDETTGAYLARYTSTMEQEGQEAKQEPGLGLVWLEKFVSLTDCKQNLQNVEIATEIEIDMRWELNNCTIDDGEGHMGIFGTMRSVRLQYVKNTTTPSVIAHQPGFAIDTLYLSARNHYIRR
jgi:hypothetical protein